MSEPSPATSRSDWPSPVRDQESPQEALEKPPSGALERGALIFARPGDPLSAALLPALRETGFAVAQAAQMSRGLGLLCRRPADAPPPALAIILGGLPGLTGSVIAKAVRALPGLADLPLILVGETPSGLARCAEIPPPADVVAILRLATVDPGSWPQPSATAPAAVETGVVLVVDDSHVNRLVVSQLARGSGHPVEMCANGTAALARIAAGGVALVLMDLHIPVMDGAATAREIRRRETGTGRRLPIIAITADSIARSRDRCLQAGMDDYLTIPLSQDQLHTAICRWLPTARRALSPATVTASPIDAVFSSGPLQRIDQQLPGTARQIITVIRHDLRQAQEEIPRLLDGGDLRSLSQAAHKLKGSSGSIGGVQLAQASADLERSAMAGDLSRCRDAVAAVRSAIGRLIERLDMFTVSNLVA